MIKHIRVKGYQSHVDTELELGNFTVVYGPSDNGKSAFYRAIKAAVQNQSGTEFINWNMDKCQVVFELENAVIVWEKSAKVNKYTVVKDGKKEEYAKLKSTVPKEVSDLMKFALLKIDKDDFTPNFVDQFDPPFLVFFSGYKIAKVVGQLTGADILFQASREIRNRERKSRQDITTQEAIADKTRTDLFKYDGVDDRLKFVLSADTRCIDVGNKLVVFDKMVKMWQVVRITANDIKDLKSKLIVCEPVQLALVSKTHNLEIGLQALKTLKDYWDKVHNISVEVQRIVPKIQSGERVKETLTPQIENIGNVIQRLNKFNEIKRQVEELRLSVDKADYVWTEGTKRFDVVNKEIEVFKLENKVCPLCERLW